jgi:hypothetical protein
MPLDVIDVERDRHALADGTRVTGLEHLAAQTVPARRLIQPLDVGIGPLHMHPTAPTGHEIGAAGHEAIAHRSVLQDLGEPLLALLVLLTDAVVGTAEAADEPSRINAGRLGIDMRESPQDAIKGA